MDLTKLPNIAGPVSVGFKHEDQIEGQTVGPVTVIELRADGHQDNLGILPGPISTKAISTSSAGVHELGWKTLSEALAIAAHYKTSLEQL